MSAKSTGCRAASRGGGVIVTEGLVGIARSSCERAPGRTAGIAPDERLAALDAPGRTAGLPVGDGRRPGAPGRAGLSVGCGRAASSGDSRDGTRRLGGPSGGSFALIVATLAHSASARHGIRPHVQAP
jgi:hypothetical protein